METPRQRVVLLDDDAATRDALGALFELEGHVVQTAADGPSGVELILRTLPDLSLIDIGLRGFDGLEVARRIRADPRGTGLRLIALSGYDGSADRDRTHAAGFDGHIGKPVETSALLRLLAE